MKEIDFDFEQGVRSQPWVWRSARPSASDRPRPLQDLAIELLNYYDMGVFEVEVRSDKLREQGGRPAGIERFQEPRLQSSRLKGSAGLQAGKLWDVCTGGCRL